MKDILFFLLYSATKKPLLCVKRDIRRSAKQNKKKNLNYTHTHTMRYIPNTRDNPQPDIKHTHHMEKGMAGSETTRQNRTGGFFFENIIVKDECAVRAHKR